MKSGDVVVLVGILLVPLHVVSVYQGLDPKNSHFQCRMVRHHIILSNDVPFLQVRRLDGEFELCVELVEEEGVRESLSHLHDPYDGGVDLVLAVLEHALLRRLLLVVRLFQLYLEEDTDTYYSKAQLLRLSVTLTWFILIWNSWWVKSLL